MLEITYERQSSLPNGQSKPVTFDTDAQPDEARFSAGHLPATARSLGSLGRAHITGAVMLGRACRPVYSVGPWLVVHTLPAEDVAVVAARYRGLTVISGQLVIPAQEWDTRCRLGMAYPVRVVTATPVAPAHQAPADGGRFQVAA